MISPTPDNGSRRFLAAGILVAMIATAAILGWFQSTRAEGFVTIDGRIKVKVTAAATEKAREQGLSGRASLAADEGMLFFFERADAYRFWMKDMRFPIDILWIRDGQIADMTVDVPVPTTAALDQLPTFAPRVPVDRVLEVPAGFAKANGLKLGMPVEVHVDSDGGSG